MKYLGRLTFFDLAPASAKTILLVFGCGMSAPQERAMEGSEQRQIAYLFKLKPFLG